MALDPRKFLLRFIDEGREHCSRITEGLLVLERKPGDAETLNALFRSAHTIKGSARMLKQLSVSKLAHHMEDVLDALRGNRIQFSPKVSDLLLECVDRLVAMLEVLASGAEPPEPSSEFCQALSRQATAEDGTNPETLPAEPSPSSAVEDGLGAASPPVQPEPPSKDVAPNPAARLGQTEYLRIHATKLDDLIRLMGEIVSENSRLRLQIRRLRDVDHSAQRFARTLATWMERQPEREGWPEQQVALTALQTSLRRSVRALSDASVLQEHLVTDLQDASLKLRMLPLSTVFDPLRRTVRDLAREHGKDVNFIVEGADTELDRKIIEKLGDPLLHMIRNSLDHGLETAAERQSAAKPARGTLALSAFYEGGFVTITLRDDGRGLSAVRIKEKALAKRLYDAETLANMSRAEVHNLIFLAGFSTSPIITDLSGRGVGMDVVHKNVVDELKGTISIESREGTGTTFFLRLPLNLAVFSLFMISAGGKVCALPGTSIVEMLSIRRDQLVEIVHKRALRLREQLIPVENLALLLGLPLAEVSKEEVLVIIISDGNEKMGLIVDEILGREEMVVKPLPPHMQSLKLVSGATLLEGDTILNVLQTPELFQRARSMAEALRPAVAATMAMEISILVVDDSVNTREIEKSILEAYGYRVVTAEDGEEAYEIAQNERFDLIVTDVEMPRLDGFSLTERLRGNARYRSVPIVIVTSLEKEEDKKRGIAVGADAYIVKSAFDQSNLLDIVRSLVG
jgi:chemotaxis protein histidine kinase CheA/ActR/RegA family two-component response regulator